MRCIKLFLLSGLLCTTTAFAANTSAKFTNVQSCLEQGKKEFNAPDYQAAKTTFTQCVQLDPKNSDAQLSLAGALLTLDDLDGADTAFRAALAEMKRTSPYLSYTYSMLGDIALKRQRNDEALEWYSKSLVSNAANVNSLVGKGVITEYKGDKKGAAGFYRSALAVEPLNLIARQRLINLEPDYMSDEEILDALKQRYAVQPDVTELTDSLRQLFSDIHLAEQRKGVSYLHNKYPKVPGEYLVVLNKGTAFEREILTLSGYQALQKHIGQDAISVFQRVGVPVQDVFKLRDLKGYKLFKKDNTLTPNGFFAYTEALQNRKAFLLPNESVPPSKELLKQMARLEEELKKAGYTEISSKELKFLKKNTKCSDETMRESLGLYLMPVSKTESRYFIIARQTPDPKKNALYYVLMKEKAKYDKTVKVPRNTLVESYAYYGYSLCLDDGKLVQE